MFTTTEKVDLKLHQCASNKDIADRILSFLMSIPSSHFMTVPQLAELPAFAPSTEFWDFSFYLDPPSNTDLNCHIQKDHSYTFYPDFGFIQSSVPEFDVITELKKNGFHVVQVLDKVLFGFKTPTKH